MAMIASNAMIDGEHLVDALNEIATWLDSANGDVTLDFSAVRRINPGALRALEELAAIADERAVTVELGGVSVDVYKVLKLARLSSRFRFASRSVHSLPTEQENGHAEPSAERSAVLG